MGGFSLLWKPSFFSSRWLFPHFRDASFAQGERCVLGDPRAADPAKRLGGPDGDPLTDVEKFDPRPLGQAVFLPQLHRDHDPSKLVNPSHKPPPKNKKCAHRSRRTKTQTPIVAKPISLQNRETLFVVQKKAGICILSNSTFLYTQKRCSYPMKKIHLFCVYLIDLAFLL